MPLSDADRAAISENDPQWHRRRRDGVMGSYFGESMRLLGRFTICVAAGLLLANDGFAQTDDTSTQTVLALGNSEIYARSLAALTMLFVIAVLLESAFATIFNWRVFLTYFSLRGVKTLVMIAIALVVVNLFNIDILANIIAAYKMPPTTDAAASEMAFQNAVEATTGPVSKFITALILAGGSNGIYNLLVALGYRQEKSEEALAPKPPKDKAWFAVRVKRKQAASEIFVKVQQCRPGELGAPAEAPAAIAGTVHSRRPSLLELLLRNPNRFPQSGGYTVQPDVIYAISVEGRDSNGNVVKKLDDQFVVFAPGAIVDFDVTL